MTDEQFDELMTLLHIEWDLQDTLELNWWGSVKLGHALLADAPVCTD